MFSWDVVFFSRSGEFDKKICVLTRGLVVYTPSRSPALLFGSRLQGPSLFD